MNLWEFLFVSAMLILLAATITLGIVLAVLTCPVWLPIFGIYTAWLLWAERDMPVFEKGNR